MRGLNRRAVRVLGAACFLFFQILSHGAIGDESAQDSSTDDIKTAPAYTDKASLVRWIGTPFIEKVHRRIQTIDLENLEELNFAVKTLRSSQPWLCSFGQTYLNQHQAISNRIREEITKKSGLSADLAKVMGNKAIQPLSSQDRGQRNVEKIADLILTAIQYRFTVSGDTAARTAAFRLWEQRDFLAASLLVKGWLKDKLESLSCDNPTDLIFAIFSKRVLETSPWHDEAKGLQDFLLQKRCNRKIRIGGRETLFDDALTLPSPPQAVLAAPNADAQSYRDAIRREALHLAFTYGGDESNADGVLNPILSICEHLDPAAHLEFGHDWVGLSEREEYLAQLIPSAYATAIVQSVSSPKSFTSNAISKSWLRHNGQHQAPKMLPEIISALSHPVGEIQSNAARVLLELGEWIEPENAARILTVAAGEPDIARRGNIEDALVAVGKGAVPSLVKGLLTENNRKQTSVQTVFKMARAANRVLAGETAGIHTLDRVRASELMEVLRKGAVPVLHPLLTDSEITVRRAAASALCELGSREPLAHRIRLEEILDDHNGSSTGLFDRPLDRRLAQAIDLLGKAGLDLIVEALSSSNPMKISRAAQLLIRLRQRAFPALPQISPLLAHRSSDTRYWAVHVLSGIGISPKSVVPLIQPLLSDSDINVRYATARGLGFLGKAAAPSVDQLIVALKDLSTRVQRAAVYALGKIGEEAAPRAVLPLISKFDDLSLRDDSARALGAMGVKAVPFLIAELKSDKPVRREYAVLSLMEMGPKAEGVKTELRSLLSDENVRVRWRAALTLVGLGGELGELTQPVLNALAASAFAASTGAYEDPQTAFTALDLKATLTGLEKLSVDALPILLRLLSQNDVDLKFNAANSIGKLAKNAPALASDALVGELRSAMAAGPFPKANGDSLEIRLVRSLKQIGAEEEAGNILVPFIGRPVVDMRLRAIDGLRVLGKVSVPALEKLIELLKEEALYDFAMPALAELGEQAYPALDTLYSIVRSQKEEHKRRLAMRVLGNLRGPKAVSAQLSILSLDGPHYERVREDSIRALGNSGENAEAAIDEIARALGDENPRLQEAAALALGKIGKKAVPVLVLALSARDASGTGKWSGQSSSRVHASVALGIVGPEAKGAVGALIKQLSAPEIAERWAAVEALELIGASAAEAEIPLRALVAKEQSIEFRKVIQTALKSVAKPKPWSELIGLQKINTWDLLRVFFAKPQF